MEIRGEAGKPMEKHKGHKLWNIQGRPMERRRVYLCTPNSISKTKQQHTEKQKHGQLRKDSTEANPQKHQKQKNAKRTIDNPSH